jgi:hypothetical protein
MIGQAIQKHQFSGLLSASTTGADLMPYMNYISIDTSSIIDDVHSNGSISCSSNSCIKLHNGGMLLFKSGTFGAPLPTNRLEFVFDPDASYSGATTGEGKAVQFELFYTGRIASRAELFMAFDSTYNPPWFSW